MMSHVSRVKYRVHMEQSYDWEGHSSDDVLCTLAAALQSRNCISSVVFNIGGHLVSAVNV